MLSATARFRDCRADHTPLTVAHSSRRLFFSEAPYAALGGDREEHQSIRGQRGECRARGYGEKGIRAEVHPPRAAKRVAGRPGIHQERQSARKAQPLAQEYEKRGSCKGEKDETQEVLKKWIDEEHTNRKTLLVQLERKLGG
jgi:hypothetical protein